MSKSSPSSSGPLLVDGKDMADAPTSPPSQQTATAPTSPPASDNNSSSTTQSSPSKESPPPSSNNPTPTPSSPPPPTSTPTPTPTPKPTPSSPSSKPTLTPPSSSTPPHSSSPSSTTTPAPSPTEPPTSQSDDSSDDSSSTTTVEVTNSDSSTSVVVVIFTNTRGDDQGTNTAPQTSPTIAGLAGASNQKSTSGGLDQKSKVAIGVVVPIAAIAILAILAVFLWKKHRARREAEAERRKEVEDYAYNPNADPTIPAVGLVPDAYEMREEGGSVGYRGWGNTSVGVPGHQASTTITGGAASHYSEAPSPRGNLSEAHSGDGLLGGSYSPEGEILGAMGPASSNNRGDVRRGPSNASSSYSAAGRSDGSDGGMGYNGNGVYYEPYNPAHHNPNGYDNYAGGDSLNTPVIQDNPARRNARIESPTHLAQQSAGISQNF